MTEISQGGANQLRRNSLGLLAVTFMVISAAAPLTGVAGAVPIAFLIEQAGGRATDGHGRILDRAPRGLHDFTPLYFGASDEIDALHAALKG